MAENPPSISWNLGMKNNTEEKSSYYTFIQRLRNSIGCLGIKTMKVPPSGAWEGSFLQKNQSQSIFPSTEGVQRHCGFGLNMAGGSLNNEAYKTNNIFTEVLKFFLKMAGILKKVMHVSATLLKWSANTKHWITVICEACYCPFKAWREIIRGVIWKNSRKPQIYNEKYLKPKSEYNSLRGAGHKSENASHLY